MTSLMLVAQWLTNPLIRYQLGEKFGELAYGNRRKHSDVT
jgi:hypothetical protein